MAEAINRKFNMAIKLVCKKNRSISGFVPVPIATGLMGGYW